jgi:hypothetical protein
MSFKLNKPARNGSLLSWATAAWEEIRSAHLTAGPGIRLRKSPSGTVISAVAGKAGAAAKEPCPFGEIISHEGSKAIRGGLIQIGPENWNMDAEEIDLETAGVWLVSIPIEAVVTRDDDEEVLLPGIESATRPAGAWTLTAWTEGTDYPANTQPSVPGGEGTAILPIGKLTITIPEGAPTGRAKLEATGCGSFHVSHCSGNFTHHRGTAESF